MSTLSADAVDLGHLDRYTGGDRALNEEILRLFEEQSGQIVGGLDAAIDSGDAKAWRMTTHTLKGAARGIGANALADAAAAAEKLDIADTAALRVAVARVRARAADVTAFIQHYLG